MDKTQLRENFINNISFSDIYNYTDYLIKNKLISYDFITTTCYKQDDEYYFELSIFNLIIQRAINSSSNINYDRLLPQKHILIRNFLEENNLLDIDSVFSKSFMLKDKEVVRFLKRVTDILFKLDDKLFLIDCLS